MTRWQWAGIAIGALITVPLGLILFDLTWPQVLLLVTAAAGLVVLTGWANRRIRSRGR